MSKINKKALGKGADALFATETESEGSIPAEVTSQGIIKIDPKLLKPNPNQPRTMFSEEALQELADSIRANGIIQPIVAKKVSDNEYYIIAGERRTRASIMAGLDQVPVALMDIDEDKNLELALIENIQRENLNPIEEALAYRKLIELHDLSQDELSGRVGKSRSAIANTMRLLSLPEYAQRAIEQGTISAGHARAILSLDTEQSQRELYDAIINEGLSVRGAETRAKNIAQLPEAIKVPGQSTRPQSKAPVDADLKAIEQQFIDALGTKVVISGSLEKGKVEISFFSKEDLTNLYDRLVKTEN